MLARFIQTAVITGPTGAVGTALCKFLLNAGVTVFAVCRPGSSRANALPQDTALHKVACDVADYAKLPTLIHQPVDAFFHLAWAHTTGAGRNDMPSQIANIRGTVEAVSAAASLGCKVFIGVGSQAEYGRSQVPLCSNTPVFPENGYGMAKLCAGQMSRVEAHRLGMDHVWIRLLSVYGPYDSPNTMIMATIRKLLAGECPALTAGEQQWDYLYASDAAHALWLAAVQGHDSAVYPLGSGQARPLRDYIIALREAIDPRLPLGFGQLPYSPQQVMYLQADISTFQQDTGFTPVVSFENGIRQTIAWVRKEKNV